MLSDHDRDKLIPASVTRTVKVNPIKVKNYSGNVRVYCESPSSLGLQIRTEGPINEKGNGKSFQCFSHASLDINAATILRNWLDQWIYEKTGDRS